MTTDPQTDPRVKNLRDAQRRLRSALIANADRLDKPFTDDPDKNPWDTFVRPAMRELKAAVDAIAAMPAAPVAAPPTGQAGLRDRIAEALVSWTYRGQEPDPETGILETVRANAYSRADAVLLVLFGPIPAGTDTATWTAIRAIQLMNEAGQQRDASAEPHRLALSTALGLGTSAPWDAIRVRAKELADGERGGDLIEEYLRFLRAQGPEPDLSDLTPEQREAIAGQFEIVKALADRGPELPPLDRDPVARRLGLLADGPGRVAAETPGPETQGEAELWLTDSARIGRTLIWSWSDVGKGAFREGYRAAQAEARALLGGERGTDQQPETRDAPVHAIPLPGSNGISTCCGRPPCEFVGERVTRDPDAVTCPGPDATPPAVVAEPGKECAASVSGNCLAEAQSETGCATEDGECIYAGQPGKEA